MKAVVLEERKRISIRDIDIPETLGPDDVRIKPIAVGICGSDVHLYTHSGVGSFVGVKAPMVLGHEASGIVLETGANVKNLKAGDRVCMEPGIPNFRSVETLKGRYNLDPSVIFWATPPVHGCLRETFVHPAILTFKLPENMTMHEGALVEPVAIGVYSAAKAKISPGDTALVIGAGTIGVVTGLAAATAGCSKVYISDIKKGKLDFIKDHYGDLLEVIDLNETDTVSYFNKIGLRGVDLVFEASGSPKAYDGITKNLLPGGRIVLVGMPVEPVPISITALQVKEISVETIFRYVNMYPRVINMISSGKLKVKDLVTKVYPFAEAAEAFEYAGGLPEKDIKIMIDCE